MRVPLQALQHVNVQPAGDESPIWFKGVILDLMEEAEILVSVAEEVQEVLPGSELRVEVPVPDAVYRFTSTVRGRSGTDLNALRLEWPREAKRIQRRDYVRVDVDLKAEVRYVGPTGGLCKLTGVTLDLSGGGVRVKLSEPIPAETKVELALDIPGLGMRTYPGRVVRSHRMESPTYAPEFWVAVEFGAITDAVRNQIVQYVFTVQREHMRKGLA